VLLAQIAVLRAQYGLPIEAINIGGGFAVAYLDTQTPTDITAGRGGGLAASASSMWAPRPAALAPRARARALDRSAGGDCARTGWWG
jgi:hypothetical protein